MQTPVQQDKIVVGIDYAKELVKLIDSANKCIDILMFDWRIYKTDITNPVSEINHALVRASRRGVIIKALTNYENILVFLKSVGINGKLWKKSKIMHTKCVIIDQKIVVSGSHNFTNNAMNENFEVSIIHYDPTLAERFSNLFLSIW